MILTLAGIIVKIIGAISKILISRLLGGEGIGLYQMAYPIYQLAVSVATAGLPVAISIMVADKLAQKDILGVQKIFKVSLSVLLLMGGIFSLLLYWCAGWLVNSHYVMDARAYYSIVALVPAIFIVTILSCFRGYFQGFQYMVPTGVSQIFEQTLRVIFMVGLVIILMPKGLEYAAAGATFATLPGVVAGLLVLLFFYYKQRTLRLRMKEEQLVSLEQPNLSSISSNKPYEPDSIGKTIQRLFVLAIPVSIANIMIPVVSSVDLFIVPRQLVEAGYHIDEATALFGYLTGMATSLVNLPTILTASLAASLVPAVSEAYTLKETSKVLERTQSALKIANLITVPAFIGMCILATPISIMLYATPYAGDPIAIMSLSIFLLGLQQVTTGSLQGLGYTAIPMINLVIGIILKCVLSWYWTAMPSMGINGAAWATNIGFGLAAILNLIFVRRYIGSCIRLVEFSKILLSAMAMGGTTAVIYYFLNPLLGNTIAVIISMGLAVIVYVSALFMVKAINLEDCKKFPIIGKFLQKRSKNG